MPTKLDKLIAAYEAERASLTAEMEECVAEMDYGKARLFFKALAGVDQQLQTLYNLQDAEHDEKEFLVRSIKFLEESLADAEEYMSRYLVEQLAGDKEKIAGLKQQSSQKRTVGHTVREVLDKLLSGELANFTLIVQDSNRLHYNFRLVRKTMIITIPEVCRHRETYTLEKRHVRHLKRLGFSFYDNKDKLMLFAPYSNISDVNAIQFILARLVFEVFYFKDLVGETFIKFVP